MSTARLLVNLFVYKFCHQVHLLARKCYIRKQFKNARELLKNNSLSIFEHQIKKKTSDILFHHFGEQLNAIPAIPIKRASYKRANAELTLQEVGYFVTPTSDAIQHPNI